MKAVPLEHCHWSRAVAIRGVYMSERRSEELEIDGAISSGMRKHFLPPLRNITHDGHVTAEHGIEVFLFSNQTTICDYNSKADSALFCSYTIIISNTDIENYFQL